MCEKTEKHSFKVVCQNRGSLFLELLFRCTDVHITTFAVARNINSKLIATTSVS